MTVCVVRLTAPPAAIKMMRDARRNASSDPLNQQAADAAGERMTCELDAGIASQRRSACML